MLAFLTLLTASTLAVMATPLKRAPQVYNIHASTTPSLCLGASTTPANGVKLINLPCASTSPDLLAFTFEPTIPGAIKLTGANFCIDAGLGFNELKLWTCIPSVPQQNWVFTGNGDNHIALYQQTECVSYSGAGCDSKGNCNPGTIACSPEAAEVWTLSAAGGVVPPPPPPPAGTELHWNGQCLGLTARAASDGTLVNMGPCLAATDPLKSTQLWNVPAKGTDGLIRLAGSNQCLDAGSPPLVNGRLMKTWTCYQGLKQQTWFHTGDDHLAITGDVQCLDVRKEAAPSVVGNVQTWQCSGSDPQQIFTV